MFKDSCLKGESAHVAAQRAGFDIPQEGIPRHFTSTGSALGIVDTEMSITQLVESECQFYKVNQEVIVQGRLRSAAHLTCSRCAEEFEQPLHIALDAVYLPMQAI